MKQIKNNATGWAKWLRKVGLPLLLVPIVAIAWSGYAGYVADNGMPVAEDGSWSSDVLAGVHEGIITASPISVANACGLGLSSCYKCHNDKRADAPSDKDWHEQHDKVNHSCVGCHQGNERLMLQKMAHRDLIADPRTTSQESCAECHSDGDMKTLLDKYKKDQ